MATDIANYIARSRPRFDRASVDREHYGNALMQNEVARIPQTNRAQDLAIQAGELGVDERQKQNAVGVLGRNFSIAANSPRPREAMRAFLASPDFVAAGKMAGLPVEQFSVTDHDSDDSIRQQAMAWAQALGAGGDQMPVGARNFDIMAREAGATPEQRAQAARIDLGLEPRAVAMREQNAPSGYEYGPDGNLRAIPGGPADPAGPNLRRNSTALRKEYEDQKAVADYRLVLPVYQRAVTAEDTRAGDISIIYALGKIFDPGSVVREGELQLSMQAAPWLQQLTSNINSQITGAGRLSPALRAELVRAMEGQVDALRMPYEQERGRYSQYATDFGFTADSVVGPDPADAFRPRGSAPNAGGWTITEIPTR